MLQRGEGPLLTEAWGKAWVLKDVLGTQPSTAKNVSGVLTDETAGLFAQPATSTFPKLGQFLHRHFEHLSGQNRPKLLTETLQFFDPTRLDISSAHQAPGSFSGWDRRRSLFSSRQGAMQLRSPAQPVDPGPSHLPSTQVLTKMVGCVLSNSAHEILITRRRPPDLRVSPHCRLNPRSQKKPSLPTKPRMNP